MARNARLDIPEPPAGSLLNVLSQLGPPPAAPPAAEDVREHTAHPTGSHWIPPSQRRFVGRPAN